MDTFWVLPGKKLQALFQKREDLKATRTLRRASRTGTGDDAALGPYVLPAAGASVVTTSPVRATPAGGVDAPQAPQDEIPDTPPRLLNSHAVAPIGAGVGCGAALPTPSAAVRLSTAFDFSGHAQAEQQHVWPPQLPATSAGGAASPAEFVADRLRVAPRRVGPALDRLPSHSSPRHAVSGAPADMAVAVAVPGTVGQGALALQKLAGGVQPRTAVEQLELEEDLSRVLGVSEFLGGGLRSIVRKVTQWRPAGLAFPVATLTSQQQQTTPREGHPSAGDDTMMSGSGRIIRVSSWAHAIGGGGPSANASRRPVATRHDTLPSPPGAVAINIHELGRHGVFEESGPQTLRPPFGVPGGIAIDAGMQPSDARASDARAGDACIPIDSQQQLLQPPVFNPAGACTSGMASASANPAPMMTGLIDSFAGLHPRDSPFVVTRTAASHASSLGRSLTARDGHAAATPGVPMSQHSSSRPVDKTDESPDDDSVFNSSSDDADDSEDFGGSQAQRLAGSAPTHPPPASNHGESVTVVSSSRPRHRRLHDHAKSPNPAELEAAYVASVQASPSPALSAPGLRPPPSPAPARLFSGGRFDRRLHADSLPGAVNASAPRSRRDTAPPLAGDSPAHVDAIGRSLPHALAHSRRRPLSGLDAQVSPMMSSLVRVRELIGAGQLVHAPDFARGIPSTGGASAAHSSAAADSASAAGSSAEGTWRAGASAAGTGSAVGTGSSARTGSAAATSAAGASIEASSAAGASAAGRSTGAESRVAASGASNLSMPSVRSGPVLLLHRNARQIQAAAGEGALHELALRSRIAVPAHRRQGRSLSAINTAAIHAARSLVQRPDTPARRAANARLLRGAGTLTSPVVQTSLRRLRATQQATSQVRFITTVSVRVRLPTTVPGRVPGASPSLYANSSRRISSSVPALC